MTARTQATANTDSLNDALTRLSRNDEQPTRTAHVPVTWPIAARLAGCHIVALDSIGRHEDAPTDYCRTHGQYANPCPEQERVFIDLHRIADIHPDDKAVS